MGSLLTTMRPDGGFHLQEQRLKFLKQQDQRQQQQAAEQEKLRRLKEIAENQEAKLKKVRALKGHVEQKRLSNGRLGEWPRQRLSAPQAAR